MFDCPHLLTRENKPWRIGGEYDLKKKKMSHQQGMRLYAIVRSFVARLRDCRSCTEELHNLFEAPQLLHTWDKVTHDRCAFIFI